LNPITHGLAAWCLAETAPRLTNRERGIVVIAGIAPDIDGIGILPEVLTRNGSHPLLWWSSYHHLLAHNLLFAVLVALVAAVVTKTNRALTAAFAFLAVHLHLIGDLVGSRGPDGYEWPIPYLYPFASQPELTWKGQWKLSGWQNIAITIVLLAVTFVLAWRRGYSPVGLFSSRADLKFVSTLRSRFPGPAPQGRIG
jgi:inner membrane protein